MSTLLQEVFERIQELPENEQDMWARWLREELESEQKWDELFAKSPDALERMADQAIAEYEAGLTVEVDELCRDDET